MTFQNISVSLAQSVHLFYNDIMQDKTENYWQNRRTIRKYSDREVTDALLEDLIEKATHAPTTGNMQLYSVIITRDADKRKELAPAHFNQPAATGAPVLLTFCADFNRFSHWCFVSDAKPGFFNFQSFMTATIDAVILTQQFVTLAEREGLGCCYLGTTTYNAPAIAKTLGLPMLVVPICTIAVGWPAEEGAVSDRLPLSAIIHRETYYDREDDEVMEYYAYKESLPESAKFVAENGKKNLAQVFTDVRYPKENNEKFSEVLFDHINKVGFRFPCMVPLLGVAQA